MCHVYDSERGEKTETQIQRTQSLPGVHEKLFNVSERLMTTKLLLHRKYFLGAVKCVNDDVIATSSALLHGHWLAVLPWRGDVMGNTFLARWRHWEYFLGAVKCVNNVLVTTSDSEERRRVSDDDERQTVVENVEQIVVLNLFISHTQQTYFINQLRGGVWARNPLPIHIGIHDSVM